MFAKKKVRFLTAELCQEGQFYYSILNHLPMGLVGVNTDGVVAFVNVAAEEMLGLEKEQIVGRYFKEGVHQRIIPDKIDSLFSFIGDTLERGIVYDGIDVGVLMNGCRGTLKISTYILKDEENQFAGVLLTITDYSIPKLMEEQVQHNECLALVGQMAAGICHEIRNPLQSVKGFIQLLQEQNINHKGVSDYTGIVISEINRINEIIKEFLQLARPSEVKFEKKNVNFLVRDIVTLINSEAVLHDVVIEEDLGKKIPPLLLDEAQLKQVLINLISNSLAAIPYAGIIKVKTRYDFNGHEVRIAVIDNGIGMDDDTIRNLGRPFFTTKDEGTGLGLSVSYKIIRDHGGRIDVESALGKGSTFTIILPDSTPVG